MSGEVEDGLRRAWQHLGRAALESLEAARALLEAALRASGLHSVAPDSLAAEIGRSLDGLIASLEEGRAFQLPEALVEPLSRALEAEIARWESRSRTDPDARPVLRAFLGLREILWEFGVRSPSRSEQQTPPPRHAEAAPEPATSAPDRPLGHEPTPKPRVQRFEVEH